MVWAGGFGEADSGEGEEDGGNQDTTRDVMMGGVAGLPVH